MEIAISDQEMQALRDGHRIFVGIPFKHCICRSEHDEIQVAIVGAYIDKRTGTVEMVLEYPENATFQLIQALVTGDHSCSQDTQVSTTSDTRPSQTS